MTRILLLLVMLCNLHGLQSTLDIQDSDKEDPGMWYVGPEYYWLTDGGRDIPYEIPTSKGYVNAPDSIRTSKDLMEFYAAPFNRPFQPPFSPTNRAQVFYYQGTLRCSVQQDLFCATLYYEQDESYGNPYLEYVPLHCTRGKRLSHLVMFIANEDMARNVNRQMPHIRYISNCGKMHEAVVRLKFFFIHDNSTYNVGWALTADRPEPVWPDDWPQAKQVKLSHQHKYVELGLPEDKTTTAFMNGENIGGLVDKEFVRPIVFSVLSSNIPYFNYKRCRLTNRDPYELLCSKQRFKPSFPSRGNYFQFTPFVKHNITDIAWP